MYISELLFPEGKENRTQSDEADPTPAPPFGFTCTAHSGKVRFKVYRIEVLMGPLLLLLMMSATETPLGPSGSAA